MKIKSKLKNKFIPVNIPKIYRDEKNNVNECLNSGWISSEGAFVKKFERSFSKYNNRRYGIAVSSGTAALDIAIKSLNLKRGDEVIISCFSIISAKLGTFGLESGVDTPRPAVQDVGFSIPRFHVGCLFS